MTSNVHMWKVSVIGVLIGILLGSAAVSRAQQPPPPRPPTPPAAPEEEELAKKLSNPVSDLVSVPFQFNWQQNVGPSEATRFILNVQPVMPFALNKDWNLIARVIVPLVSQPALVDGGEPVFGVSDILATKAGIDLGSRTRDQSSLDECSESRHREVERRTIGCRAQADGKDDVRDAVESDLVLFRQCGPP